VEAALFPAAAAPGPPRTEARTLPDFASIHEQLRQHKHLTLQLLWEEYRQTNPDGYRYSRYCYLYQRWRSKLDVVLRQEHKAGEKMFVDWAGATIPVYDRQTGIAWQAPLFVAALGASSYTGPKPRATCRWKLGSAATCMPLNIFTAFRRWPFPTTARPE
jgi:transposase